MVIFAVFGWWQLRVSSPIVDLRTTVTRPVLTTNVASVAVAFGMFALSLVAPQILELPPETGYGLGQSMLCDRAVAGTRRAGDDGDLAARGAGRRRARPAVHAS